MLASRVASKLHHAQNKRASDVCHLFARERRVACIFAGENCTRISRNDLLKFSPRSTGLYNEENACKA